MTQNNIRGYVVQLWCPKRDEVQEFNIPLSSCVPTGGTRPNRSVASRAARERYAEAHGIEDLLTVKVLSVTEWVT